MSTGFVLDFSDATFAEFMMETADIDIYSRKYETFGISKAKRLRAFWIESDDAIIAKVLTGLLEYWSYDKNSDELRINTVYAKCRLVIERLSETQPERETPIPPSSTAKKPQQSKEIFIVHGHDDGAKESVARFLEKLELQPIILHEQANLGRTIIEKIEAHSDVGFAVVLLTPDDFGGLNGQPKRPRARQNVILELGYFIGSLGRQRVFSLRKGEVEIPSDFGGVVWENLDSGGGWKNALVRELKAANYEIDLNRAY